MGMYGQVIPVSEDTIRRIHADPLLVLQVMGNVEELENERKKATKGPGLIGRMLGKKPPAPPPAEPLVLAPGEGNVTDLDKAWHGAHWLLTGSVWEGDWPLSFILKGGTDLDYDGPWNSPPRTFSAAEAREIAEALAKVSDDELRARYQPDEMMKAEIYPEIWDREPDDVEDPQGYVMSALADVRSAVNVAVERGWGLIVSVD
ncbi:MAG: YfbM family protein [Gemmatimonadota bacterium]